MTWITRQGARTSEMNPRLSLRIEAHADGDVEIFIEYDGMPLQDEAGTQARVEFCSTSGGAGRSPHTRQAVFSLMEAMRKDAQEKPDGIPEYPVHTHEELAKLADST